MGKKAQKLTPLNKAGNTSGNTSGGTITLPDGTKVPIGLPPGVDPALAQQAIEYLRANPEAAKKAVEDAQRLLRNPNMAQEMMAARRQAADPAYQQRLEALKNDPELKPVFDDLAANGAQAMEKYWDDKDLMSKISQRMSEASISPAAGAETNGTGGSAASKIAVANLHDAAKAADVEAVARLVEEGADVNEKDARGITALGVAVGFNKVAIVRELVKHGADVNLSDARGNTPLHYAAGYGRKEAAEILIGAGASLNAVNLDGQSPEDVAVTNKETHMIPFLQAKGSKKIPEDKDIYL